MSSLQSTDKLAKGLSTITALTVGSKRDTYKSAADAPMDRPQSAILFARPC